MHIPPTPPRPTPRAHWNPTTASSCLRSDNDLKDTQLPAPPTPARSSFPSQKALQSVPEGSTARHSSRKEKKRKEDQLSDCRCKNESHCLTFQNACGSLSSSITMGKNTVQVQMLSAVTCQASARTLLLLVFWRCLFTVVLLILLDQELLGGPSELPTLHLPLCGLHHYRGQTVLQFAATVEI